MLFWYLAVWCPSAVYDGKEIGNETPNGEFLLMMPYDAKEQHFPWSSSTLSTLSGACGNPISSSSPHTQTDTQANTSINTQTITGANTQAQTHKHKHTNNYRYKNTSIHKHKHTSKHKHKRSSKHTDHHTQAPIHANKNWQIYSPCPLQLSRRPSHRCVSMPIREVCLNEKDQRESQWLMRIVFACHIFKCNIFFVIVIIHLFFFTIFISLSRA